MITGYLHPAYADSLSEFGLPYELPACGGWILKRRIPGFSDYDAMGCYPLFACQRWSLLPDDLRAIQDDIVSLALVTDPFGNFDPEDLKGCFDLVLPFKQHYFVDLNSSIERQVSSHHRRYANKALQEVNVELVKTPHDALDDWTILYTSLAKKHSLTGIRAFSKASFSKQLGVPGITAFRAISNRSTVGMLLWYILGDVGYYHLGASSDEGYALHVSFALFWVSIQHFKSCGLSWLNLGGGAGLQDNDADGLSRFKKAWSNDSRLTYFCGRIFDQDKYMEITKARFPTTTDFFPAYRKGEFA